MALNNDLMQLLLQTFAAEAQEHLQAINQHLLALEKQPPPNEHSRLLAEIFREAHSLKGAARAVNLDEVGALAHHLETLFGRVQNGQLSPDLDLFNLIYQTLDAIGALVQAATTGEKTKVEMSSLATRLQAATHGQLPPPTEQRPSALVIADEHKPVALTRSAPDKPPLPVPSAAIEPAPRSPEFSPRAIEETVRIATSKLDALMTQVGELQVTRIGAAQRLTDITVLDETLNEWETRWRKARPNYRRLLLIAENRVEAGRARAEIGERREVMALLEFLEANETRLHEAREQLSSLRRRFETDNRRLAQVTADLQDDVRRSRMLPIATVFDIFPRMVRDLAHDMGKDVTLVIHGGETEVDRSILEQIKDPLTHLLRNCVDHGLETPTAREAAGKPQGGTISLLASQRGDSLIIEVSDDGSGIEIARVRAAGVKKGLMTAEAAEALSNYEALWLIFRSGFSTSPLITDISGRGVGLDVVREHVERLQGLIEVETQPGQGTRFTLTLPLTVTTTLCLLARAAGQAFALPIANVTRIVRVKPEEVGQAEGHEVIRVDGRPLALRRLADILNLEAAAAPPPPATPKLIAIILGSAEKRVAFVVESLLNTQEVVIKKLPLPLRRVRHLAGATILATGEVVLILNVADLLRSISQTGGRVITAARPKAEVESGPPTLLVADDSITTRALEKNILEAAGYQVHVAADGLEAWNKLQSQHYDLLISDVNMPRLDGFELTAKVRADEQLKNLPIILVTSLDSREDRQQGVEVGADAYIVKGAFDQNNLLATIQKLI